MATPTTDHRHEACTEAHTSGPFADGALHCVECGQRIVPEPGTYVVLAYRTRDPLNSFEHPALITSVEQRDGYQYVGWRNEGPGRSWDSRAGAWGYFRAYPEATPYGTTILRVLCASGCYVATAEMQYQRGLITSHELAAGAPAQVIHRSPCPVVRQLVHR